MMTVASRNPTNTDASQRTSGWILWKTGLEKLLLPLTYLHTGQHPGTGEQDQLHTTWLPTHIPPAPYLNKGGEEMPSHATDHSKTVFQQYISRNYK